MLKRWNPPLFSPSLSWRWVACKKCLGYGEAPCEHCEGDGCSLCDREGHAKCTRCRGLGEVPDRHYETTGNQPDIDSFPTSFGDVL